jgi:hypothetical protein
MSYLEELLPEFRNGAKIRRKYWGDNDFVEISDFKKGLIFTNKELEASDWEFYQEPIDWETIIKKRCLCWFWNIERKVLGILVDYNEDDMYLRDGDSYYQNCRPVHKDEVIFYEDEKDGNI